MQLILTKEQEKRISQMSVNTGMGFEEIVRKAIGIYEAIHKFKKEGYKFGLEKDGLFYEIF